MMFAVTVEGAVGGRGMPRPASSWVWAVPAMALVLIALIMATNLNDALFKLVNGAARYGPDGLWAGLTLLGDALVVLVLLLFFVGRRPDVVWTVVIAAVLAALASHALKDTFGVLRPASVLAGNAIHVIGPTRRFGSFPSGHCTAIFTLAAALCLRTRSPTVAALVIPAAALIGLSRVAVGAHWPLDVLGGILVGWLATVAGGWLADRWSWGYGRVAQLIIGVLLLAGTVWLWSYDTGYVQALWFQRAVAAVSAFAGLSNVYRLRRG